MKVNFPSYYSKFKCLMGDCPHSCCIGWDVEMDSESENTLTSGDDALSKKLKKAIKKTNDGYEIKTCEDKRCPFLLSDGLCEIMKERGVDSAPEICRRHPRFFTCVDYYYEGGVSLACPMAAELILSSDYEGARLTPFEYSEKLWDGSSMLGRGSTEELLAIREEMFIDIFDKENTPADLIASFIPYAENTIKSFDLCSDAFFTEYYGVSGGYRFIPDVKVLDEILEFYVDSFDHIDTTLPMMLSTAREKLRLGGLDSYLSGFFAPYFKRLLAHEIYRYVLEGVCDEYTVGVRLKGALLNAIVGAAICFGEGAYTFDEVVAILSGFSRDVEYGENNMDNLIRACYMYVTFQDTSLYKLYEKIRKEEK